MRRRLFTKPALETTETSLTYISDNCDNSFTEYYHRPQRIHQINISYTEWLVNKQNFMRHVDAILDSSDTIFTKIWTLYKLVRLQKNELERKARKEASYAHNSKRMLRATK